MPAIKSMDRIQKKWVDRSSTAGETYKDGVLNPRADWKTQTLAAVATHKAAVQESLAKDSFKKAIDRSSTDYQKQMASTKGVERWARGIDLSRDNYSEGFGPYATVIANTKLPDRGAKGSPTNYDRSKKMGEALHAAKVSRLGS